MSYSNLWTPGFYFDTSLYHNIGFEPKRGWKECVDSRILSLYKEVCEEAIRVKMMPSMAYAPKVYVRPYRGGTTIASCCYKRSGGNKYTKGNWKSAIVLSPFVLTCSDSAVISTLGHELAHACTAGEGHSENWRAVANKITAKWGLTHSRYEADPVVISDLKNERATYKAVAVVTHPYKYEVYCPHCDVSCGKYKTACQIVQHPERWKHSRCGTKLQVRNLEID